MNKRALPLVSLALCILLLSSLPALASVNPAGTQDTSENNAAALLGVWSGTDNLGNMLVTIAADNRITIAHPGADLLPEEGAFTAGASTILMTFDDGASQTYRYLLSGDIMLLTDEEFLFPVRLTRLSGEKTQGAAVKLLGTWGSNPGGTYGEITFTGEGKLFVSAPNREDFGRAGTYTVDGNTITSTMDTGSEVITFGFLEENLIISENGTDYTFNRKPGPLERTVAEKEEAGPGLDPNILGTFGGMEANLYVEWTFHGDGTFQRYAPEDDFLCFDGSYETKNGILTMHTTQAILKGAYTASAEVLGIAFDKDDSFGYRRKTGPLTRTGSLEE